MAFTIPFGKKDDQGSDPNRDNSLNTIRYILTISSFGVIIVAVWSARIGGSFWSAAGLSAFIAFASLLCGGLLGFLFGIPRSLQRATTTEQDTSNHTTVIRERPYSNNTNLEQISDWLTKIIVGVSLTQLPALERNFHLLTTSATEGFGGLLPHRFAYAYSACLIIFYALCGFLAVYLWAKIYLLQQLTILDKMLGDSLNAKLDRVEDKLVEVQLRQANNEVAKLEARLEDFNRVKNKIKNIESKDEFKSVIETAKPDAIRYIDDCQKGRWGGLAISVGYQLSASFFKKDPLDDTYEITLTVSALPGHQLTGDVYFFLHDSFYPDCVQKQPAVNNQASIVVPSFEAFTVGAICNGGLVKLELDLNLYEKTPADYRYSAPLELIDDVKAKLDELKARQGQTGS